MAKKLTITLVKSPIGYQKNQRTVAVALGLKKLNSTVQHDDSPTIRGMVNKISHLLSVVEG